MNVLRFILSLLIITCARGATIVVAENLLPGPERDGGNSRGVGGLFTIGGQPQYSDGMIYENSLTGIEGSSFRDLFFQITVEPVPEPGVPALICLFFGALSVVRRRREPRSFDLRTSS